MVAGAGEIGIYSGPRQRKAVMATPTSTVVANVGASVTEEPQDQKQPRDSEPRDGKPAAAGSKREISNWAGTESPMRSGRRLFVWRWTWTRPACFALFHAPDPECALRDGVLRVTWPGVQRVASRPPRAGSWSSCAPIPRRASGDRRQGRRKPVGEGWRLSFKPTPFRGGSRKSTGPAPAMRTTSTPGIRSVPFAASSSTRRTSGSSSLRSAEDQQSLQKPALAAGGAGATRARSRGRPGREVRSRISTTRGEFSIPDDFDPAGMSPGSVFGRWIANGVAIASNKLFPYRSWPWTVARESALVATNQGKYTEIELQRLYESEENGPLCYLVTAALLRCVSVPLSRLFAAKGLENSPSRISARTTASCSTSACPSGNRCGGWRSCCGSWMKKS